jgi:hypothetical protein
MIKHNDIISVGEVYLIAKELYTALRRKGKNDSRSHESEGREYVSQ